MSKRYQRQRKGIILLAIISLLTMFMLIGVMSAWYPDISNEPPLVTLSLDNWEFAPQKHLDSRHVSTC